MDGENHRVTKTPLRSKAVFMIDSDSQSSMGPVGRSFVGILAFVGVVSLYARLDELVDGPRYELRADSSEVDVQELGHVPPIWLVERDGWFGRKKFPLRFRIQKNDLSDGEIAIWEFREQGKWESIPWKAETDIDRMREEIEAADANDDRDPGW